MGKMVYLFGKIDSIEIFPDGLIKATANGKSQLYKNTDARMLKLIQQWVKNPHIKN